MTTFTVRLTQRENIGIGTLEGHPVQPEVRTMRIGPDLGVSLWELGKHRIGEGLLRRVGDAWVGTCNEFAGLWHVRGRAGSGELTFSEERADG